MIFSYKTYWNATFVLPVVMLAIMLVLLISSSYSFWVKAVRKRQTVAAILSYVFCLFIVIGCSIPQVKYLRNGGIHLLQESEADTLFRIGVIESVYEPSKSFPGFKSQHRYGADIVIDGERYFAVTCGDFVEGDRVMVHYLPSSHFILSISAADANECEVDNQILYKQAPLSADE